MLRDAFYPPPLGDTRAMWIVNGQVYHEWEDAYLAARDAGLCKEDAEDYLRILMVQQLGD